MGNNNQNDPGSITVTTPDNLSPTENVTGNVSDTENVSPSKSEEESVGPSPVTQGTGSGHTK
jgi:hypothetical protein